MATVVVLLLVGTAAMVVVSVKKHVAMHRVAIVMMQPASPIRAAKAKVAAMPKLLLAIKLRPTRRLKNPKAATRVA